MPGATRADRQHRRRRARRRARALSDDRGRAEQVGQPGADQEEGDEGDHSDETAGHPEQHLLRRADAAGLGRARRRPCLCGANGFSDSSAPASYSRNRSSPNSASSADDGALAGSGEAPRSSVAAAATPKLSVGGRINCVGAVRLADPWPASADPVGLGRRGLRERGGVRRLGGDLGQARGLPRHRLRRRLGGDLRCAVERGVERGAARGASPRRPRPPTGTPAGRRATADGAAGVGGTIGWSRLGCCGAAGVAGAGASSHGVCGLAGTGGCWAAGVAARRELPGEPHGRRLDRRRRAQPAGRLGGHGQPKRMRGACHAGALRRAAVRRAGSRGTGGVRRRRSAGRRRVGGSGTRRRRHPSGSTERIHERRRVGRRRGIGGLLRLGLLRRRHSARRRELGGEPVGVRLIAVVAVVHCGVSPRSARPIAA